MLNLTLNDAHGAGRTQLWLGMGPGSQDRLQADDGQAGDDWSAVIQRYQPLTAKFGLVAAAGITSYDRPTGRTKGGNFKLGVAIPVD